MPRDLPEDWPLRQYSQYITGPHHDWHVQVAGDGDCLLLLHGAGGSAHSFRDVLPLLETTFRVVVPDLPGHGFTRLGAQRRSGLAAMAQDISELCQTQGWEPKAVIGHSAGAAIGLEMARHNPIEKLVGINPALDTFDGIAGVLFPAIARVLASVPFAARIFSGASANPARIKALIDSTGSHLTPEGLELYRRLVAREAHVNGALMMMAQWNLADLLRALPEITTDVLFLTGSNDTTVPPRVSAAAASKLPRVLHEDIPGYGHPIHEEAPEMIAKRILSFLHPKE